MTDPPSVSPQLDIDRLNSYVTDKRLKRQVHPTDDLLIWNYSETTQFEKLWDDITLQCRGLITDSTGRVVARSFNKFFNENERPYDATPEYSVYAKVDGSLGILFWHRTDWILASRGSFTSPQAIRGRQILDERYGKVTAGLDRDLAYSLEIIYPENRIVVDYGGAEKLIFLAAFRRDGTEVDAQRNIVEKLGVEVVKMFPPAAITELASRDTANEEGYVVRFANGTRIKIKFSSYVALHRVVTNITSSWIYEQYVSGKEFVDLCGNLPDEFFKWAKIVWDNIDHYYKRIRQEAEDTFRKAMKEGEDTGVEITRGDFARKIKASPYKNALFTMYNGEDPRLRLLKLVDPGKMEPVSKGIGSGFGKGSKRTQDKPLLVLLYGTSGSGRTSFAKQWVETHPKSIIVNKNDLYEAFFKGSVPKKNRTLEVAGRQKLLGALEANLIRDTLLRGASVVADATRLGPELVRRMITTVPLNCDVQVRMFEASVAECAIRLQEAGRAVDMKILKAEHKDYSTYASTIQSIVDEELAKRKKTRQGSLPPCFVFDIDGTLAIRGDRHAFDETKVLLDTPNEDVVAASSALCTAGFPLHICTGRTEQCRTDTAEWLARNGIKYDTLQMRAVADSRADFQVKEDMWNEISKQHFITMIYDDRAQVVHHARTLGYTVAQVAYGEF